MLFNDYFEKCLAHDHGLPALVDGERAYSWTQIDEISRGVASALTARQSGDAARVAVYSPNDAMAFACILGVLRADCVWVPLNWRNTIDVNAHFVSLTGCEFLFFHSSLAGEAAALSARSDVSCQFICIDGEAGEASLSLADFVACGSGRAPEPQADADRLVALFPTGGTTGLSKAAKWSHRTLAATMNAFWQALPSQEPIRHLVAGPMTHAAGLLMLLMLPGAGTSVILKTPDPLTILESIERHRITHLYVPPTLLYMMLAHPRVREFDYSSLRYMVLAAAPVAPSKLREAIEVFGPVMCQSFGQAEAPMFMTFLSTADLLAASEGGSDRFASCGRETLVARLAIMDEDGNLLPAGRRGEIVVKGPLVFAGYHDNNAQAAAEASCGGWHRTGDVGYRDADGFYYIVDRKKDMVVTGGFNVYTAEVEQVVLSHPGVRDCVVIGVPDPKWGEAVKAVIEARTGAEVGAEEVIDMVKKRLGSIHAPKSIEIWNELPRSGNGKVLKRLVRDRFWKEQERQV